MIGTVIQQEQAKARPPVCQRGQGTLPALLSSSHLRSFATCNRLAFVITFWSIAVHSPAPRALHLAAASSTCIQAEKMQQSVFFNLSAAKQVQQAAGLPPLRQQQRRRRQRQAPCQRQCSTVVAGMYVPSDR